MSENEEVVKLYWMVRTQVKLSPMGDIIGIDHSAVMNILKLHEIEDKRRMFDEILACFNIEQEVSHELHEGPS